MFQGVHFFGNGFRCVVRSKGTGSLEQDSALIVVFIDQVNGDAGHSIP